MATREEYLPALEWFSKIIDQKLNKPKNVAKAHWSDASNNKLLRLLEIELDELHEAVYLHGDVISECADVAAFAMMIADNHKVKNNIGS